MDRARQTIECRGRRVQKKLFKFHFGHEKRSHPITPPSSLGPNSPRSKGDSSSKVSPDPLVMLCVSPLLSSHAPICPCRRAPRCPQSLSSFVSNEILRKSAPERVPTPEHAPVRSTPFPCCIRLHSWLHSWIPSKAVASLTAVAGGEFCFHLNGCLSLPWGCCA